MVTIKRKKRSLEYIYKKKITSQDMKSVLLVLKTYNLTRKQYESFLEEVTTQPRDLNVNYKLNIHDK